MYNALEDAISSCQHLDQHRLRRKLKAIPRRELGDGDARVRALREAIRLSQQQVALRAAAIPAQIAISADLPIAVEAEHIARLLSEHQVVVVAGDTGSGKTTQLPKICLQAGFGRKGLIGHTQPRRLAAASVADRIAEELDTRVGDGVAFQVRFREQLSDSSYLKLMTDGILLAEIQQDRFLNRYDLLIIDEAHERSLNIDFLLGYLRQLLPRRGELKLLITSATIDVEKFAAHFRDAPVVNVAGRTYPVETYYEPVQDGEQGGTEDDQQIDAIVKAVRDIEAGKFDARQPMGDILVFLASEREIRETANRLRKERFANTEILPLYARLRHAEQVRIFSAHRGRRIVLATNVAETSITVPGINYVVDTGKARISRYSLQSKVQRLPVEAVSQASANQRKGRCGRVANGVCIRLYSERDFESRPQFTDPEILRTNLASVILQMLNLELGDVAAFPFLDKPEASAISEGFKLLSELQAINERRELSATGRIMARLPLDPKLARMLVEAQARHCLSEMLIIASALSVQDPREIFADNRDKALEMLSEFNHERSDFLGFVNLWNRYEKERQERSQSQLRKFCKSYHLSYMRMREWREVHRQLLLGCQRLNFKINRKPGSYAAIHKSILSGSLNQVASRQEDREFLGNRHRKFRILPSSVLAGTRARWLVTSELIDTGQTFAAMAAIIEPEWVVEMAAHEVRREYLDPHWSATRQQAMIYEKVSLYGLAIIERNPVSLQSIDPVQAREIFIDQALVAGSIETKLPFARDNADYLESLRKEEEKYRQPELLVSQREIERFYQQSIPEHVCSTKDLEQWLRQQGKAAQQKLSMAVAKLFAGEVPEEQRIAFPDQAEIQSNTLKIDYQFEPGAGHDGATIAVPVALLGQLNQADIDWAVPGLLRDRCIALLKGLPKALRKRFIPVSAYVDTMLPQLHGGDGDLVDSMRAHIARQSRISLAREQLQQPQLPGYLQVKLRVLDGSGKLLAEGADLGELQQRLGVGDTPGAVPTLQGFAHELEQIGLKDWEFGDLPESVRLQGDLVLTRYPALVDDGHSVSIKLFSNKAEAVLQSRRGAMRLYMLRSVQQKNQLQKQLLRFRDGNVLKLPAPLSDLVEDALAATYLSVFDLYDSLPRNKDEFEQRLPAGKASIISEGERLIAILGEVLDQNYELRQKISDLRNLAYLQQDITQQLDELLQPGFLASAGLDWVREYPRYLQAIAQRLEKVLHRGDRDQPATELIARLWTAYK
ncbi:MAG: ATP-dependent RNA helicase HrpA, partial [Gammaproteobacteria bacterium]